MPYCVWRDVPQCDENCASGFLWDSVHFLFIRANVISRLVVGISFFMASLVDAWDWSGDEQRGSRPEEP